MKLKNQRGQSLIEYVILVALVALVSVSSTKALGSKISRKVTEIKNQIDTGIPVTLGRNNR